MLPLAAKKVPHKVPTTAGPCRDCQLAASCANCGSCQPGTMHHELGSCASSTRAGASSLLARSRQLLDLCRAQQHNNTSVMRCKCHTCQGAIWCPGKSLAGTIQPRTRTSVIIYEQASRVAQTLTTACRECCPMQHTWFQKVTIALHAAQDVVQDTMMIILTWC